LRRAVAKVALAITSFVALVKLKAIIAWFRFATATKTVSAIIMVRFIAPKDVSVLYWLSYEIYNGLAPLWTILHHIEVLSTAVDITAKHRWLCHHLMLSRGLPGCWLLEECVLLAVCTGRLVGVTARSK